jgi:hypothetical protein
MKGTKDQSRSTEKTAVPLTSVTGPPPFTQAVLIVIGIVPVSLIPMQSWADDQIAITTGVYITSIVVNGLIRIAAIAAGTYVVWLGHNTLIKGVKGEFEFTGKFGRLKGSVPGILFVFLGAVVIGWALYASHYGKEVKTTGDTQEQSEIKGTSVPFVPPPPPPPR